MNCNKAKSTSRPILIGVLGALITACGANGNHKPVIGTPSGQSQTTGSSETRSDTKRFSITGGDYRNYPALHNFIAMMVEKHGFDKEDLIRLFSLVKRQEQTLKSFNRAGGPTGIPAPGSWSRYRSIFMTEKRIRQGAEFIWKYRNAMKRAEAKYQVPAEYIAAIIGIETYYGSNLGKTPVLDTLTTVAMDFQRRSKYFTGELEKFLLMTRSEGMDPLKLYGSYAGAMGLGQFMPSSFVDFAVDFDGNAVRDLWNPVDVIGSIANYFRHHNWRLGKKIAIPATYSSNHYRTMKTGFRSQYSLNQLVTAGIKPIGKVDSNRISLIRLRSYKDDHLWLGLDNFYVITRYNNSTKYAMVVHELAQAIKNRVKSTRYAFKSALYPKRVFGTGVRSIQ